MNIPRQGCERVCWNKPLRMDQTDAAVWHEVCQLLAQPERLEQAYRQRLHPQPQAQASHGLETQMGKLRRGIARLIDSYADGVIDKQEFEPRVTRMRAQLQHLETQIQHLKAEGEMEDELRLIVGRLETFAAQVHDGLQQADFHTRREIIRSLVKRVDVDQQHIRVVFRVSPIALPPASDHAPHNWQDSGRRLDARTLQRDDWAVVLRKPVAQSQQRSVGRAKDLPLRGDLALGTHAA
jgi:site-specific DNA recombinase